jgi:hypothetical protein
MNDLINRLGLDSWASNLAVNLMENNELIDGYKFECNDYSIAVSKVDNKHVVLVRAYVPGSGWQTSEIAY